MSPSSLAKLAVYTGLIPSLRRPLAGLRTAGAAAALLLPALGSAAQPAGRPLERALTPAEAMASFQLERGLRIELVAAEPMVEDPVAFAWDERLRLYVVENRGYPDPLQTDGKPNEPWTTRGRIALLEDTDGDGRYDKRTTFADGLGYPNGIAVWRGGVFVTASPDLFYLKDHDGDGVADDRRVVLTGFGATKTAQIRACFPTLGLDGMMYVAGGRNGGKVTSPEHPERPAVEFTPNNSRFNPDTLEFELVGGNSQFGLEIDDFGRRFGLSNRHPIMHTVLEPRQLERNPYLAFNQTRQEVSKVQAEAKVWPISQAHVTTFWADIYRPNPDRLSHDGTFTCACGHHIFGGTALTSAHVGNFFICEPAQNLVQRQVMRPEGASFRSELPYTGTEFLASTDISFRPVSLGTGPDGALYIADMYRFSIDHPQYVPEQARPQIDFEGPVHTGRLYRIMKDAVKPVAPMGTTMAEICRALESPISWWRNTAHRLLLERADPAALPLLEEVAMNAPLAASRARALWTLHGLDGLQPALITAALRDRDPGVREQGIVLAGASADRGAAFAAPLLAMADDANARVRFVAALTLGDLDEARVPPALAKIALRDGEDEWTRAAVLSGVGNRMEEFFSALKARRTDNPATFAAVMEELSEVFGAGASPASNRKIVAEMLAEDRDLSWCLGAVVKVAEGMRGRKDLGLQKGDSPLVALFDPAALDDFFRRVARVARDDQALSHQRASAVALLGQTNYERVGPLLVELLDPRQPAALQLEAVRALERLGDPRGAAQLLEPRRWKQYTPQIRASVVSTLTSKPALVGVLFGAIERGEVRAADIPSGRRTRLLEHSDPKVRAGAQTAFAKLEGGGRMQVYERYREILNEPVEAARGAEPFVRACSTCHTYDGKGGTVGPDLTGVRNQSSEALLLHTLVPNHEITPGYEAVSVTTRDGRTISGRLASESDSSLTLRTPFDTEETVARRNIAEYSASGLSLMPDGLEQSMTREELAGVVAYLRQHPSMAAQGGR
jgi:putative membrane-bound dehydrogenase-like protein